MGKFDISKALGEYSEALTAYQVGMETTRKLIETLNDQLNIFKMPSIKEMIIVPLVEDLQEQLPGHEVDCAGPFGLDAAYVITTDIDENTEACMTVIVERDDGEYILMTRDYSVDNGLYDEGTIGYMNGMNHPLVPLPNTVVGILQYLMIHAQQTMKYPKGREA